MSISEGDLLEVESDKSLFVAGQEETIYIQNELSFDEITISLKTTPVFDVGTYVPNSLLERVEIIVLGETEFDLVDVAGADQEPFALLLNRESNNLRNRVGDSNNFFKFKFPQAIGVQHQAYIKIKMNTLTNMSDGAATAITTAATVDIKVKHKLPGPGRRRRISKIVTAIACGTETLTTDFIDPTRVGYKATGVMLALTDDGVLAETNYTKIELLRGSKILAQGTVNQLQEAAKDKYGIAQSDGLVFIKLNTPISASDIQVRITQTGSQTNHRIYYMLSSVQL
ncbi:hypothetical protein KAR91_11315 [Candidatus Pacearchaeota archaeon]|nr:hypothetical protein [Candidatus Pacearchaeota archaeon]